MLFKACYKRSGVDIDAGTIAVASALATLAEGQLRASRKGKDAAEAVKFYNGFAGFLLGHADNGMRGAAAPLAKLFPGDWHQRFQPATLRAAALHD